MDKKEMLTKELFPKELRGVNKKALDSFGFYKEIMEIVDGTNVAMGKKTVYTSTQNSTLHFKIGIRGLSSTEKI